MIDLPGFITGETGDYQDNVYSRIRRRISAETRQKVRMQMAQILANGPIFHKQPSTLSSVMKEHSQFSLKGAHAKDASGNRYEIVDHYGGTGLPIPEMLNLRLVSAVLFKVNRPMPYIGALSRSVFDDGFVVVKPVEKV